MASMETRTDVKSKNKNFLLNIPPWFLIGSVAVLFPIFAFMTINNINRQKENSIRLLYEKGAALIKAFEAGTRTGMMMHGVNFQLQRLLMETAQQPDITYLLVTDDTGKILAHNNPEAIGKYHGRDLNLREILKENDVKWRQISLDNGMKIFETFRKFNPSVGPMALTHGHMMRRQWPRKRGSNADQASPEIIFVGLDMSTIESARLADARHTIVMAAILLLVGLSGITLLFLTQSYRTARTSLHRIKAFSDNIVEHIPIGILTIDSQNKLGSINNAAEKILCIEDRHSIGKNAQTILPKKLYEKIERLKDSEGFIGEVIDCTTRNKKIPIELNTTLLYDEGGVFLGKVILLKDLSEVSELRKEIARNQRLASIGRLAAGVAHEIRNPLSSIKGFATYFKERYGEKAEDENVANVMAQEVDRLNRVVSQLLEFSKPVPITKKTTHLKPFIENSLKMIEQQAGGKNIHIQANYLLENDEFAFDPDRMSQVLLNLYLNSLESMDTDGQLTVDIKRDNNRQGVAIEISDTGTGINEHDLANIFDPYFTTKPEGTGIGLAIVHNIIEAHNGTIHISSSPGNGTRARVFLPDV